MIKWKIFLQRFLLPVMAAGALASPSQLAAADAPSGPPRRPPGPGEGVGPGGPGGGLQRPPVMQRMLGGVERILDDEQRRQFRDELMNQRDTLRGLDEKAAKLRREFEQALYAEKLDENAVRAKSASLSEVETERSLVRARAFAKIRPTLSAEQLEQVKNLGNEPLRDGGYFRGPAGAGSRPPRPVTGGVDPLPPPAPPPPAPPTR